MILKLSHRTIDFYIQQACSKLKVVNKTQAVVKASQLGLLPR